MLENLGTGIIMLLLGFIAGKIVGDTLNKIFLEIELDKNLNRIKKRNTSIAKGISSLVSLTIYVVTVILFLNQIKILMLTLKIILWFIIILVLVTLFLNLTNILPNLIGKYKLNQKIKVNQTITTKNYSGKIQRKGLLKITLITKDKEKLKIPNQTFLKNIKKTKIE